MMQRGSEPLHPSVWLDHIRRLACSPPEEMCELPRSIRHAFHMAQLAPAPLSHLVGRYLDEARFEAFLDAEAHESAVLALMGHNLAVTLTRTGQTWSAKVGLEEEPERYCHSQGHTPAAVLLTAWISLLASQQCEEQRDEAELIYLSQHRAQS